MVGQYGLKAIAIRILQPIICRQRRYLLIAFVAKTITSVIFIDYCYQPDAQL
jgi:hypothetical protein